jgi:hypothetical protein
MESNALPGNNGIQITQAGATIVLTQANVAGPASAAHGDLDLTDAVTIQGVSGNPSVRPLVQSSNGDRIFNINAAGDDIVISGLRLTGGNTTGTRRRSARRQRRERAGRPRRDVRQYRRSRRPARFRLPAAWSRSTRSTFTETARPARAPRSATPPTSR